MKIIKVKNCKECTHLVTKRRESFLEKPHKYYCEKNGDDIEDITDIPDWCLLENYHFEPKYIKEGK